MKVTEETLSLLPEKEQGLAEALLKDIDEINQNYESSSIYLDWQDYHNEYSPERVDPCPDYYGMYTIRRERTKEMLGTEMTINDMDISLCLLHNYLMYE